MSERRGGTLVYIDPITKEKKFVSPHDPLYSTAAMAAYAYVDGHGEVCLINQEDEPMSRLTYTLVRLPNQEPVGQWGSSGEPPVHFKTPDAVAAYLWGMDLAGFVVIKHGSAERGPVMIVFKGTDVGKISNQLEEA